MKHTDEIKDKHSQKSSEKAVDINPGLLRLIAKDHPVDQFVGIAPSGITYHDSEGRITDADDHAKEILTKACGKWSGLSFSNPEMDVIHRDGRQLNDAQDPVKIALRTREIVSDVVLGFQPPDNELIRWLLVTAMPVFGDNDTSKVICQIRDITERVQQQDFLKLDEEFIDKLDQVLETEGLDTQDPAAACQEIIEFLSEFLAFPEVTHIKIFLGDAVYTSRDFKVTNHHQISAIRNRNMEIGEIALYYQVDSPNALPQTGLQADKILSETLAEWLGWFSMIVQKNQEIAQLKDEALTAYDRTIEAWSAALETSDKEASGHTRRVTELAVELAKEMGFPEENLMDVRRGALLHDIGKLSIPDEIILKPGKLTENEYEIVKTHPQFTHKWLSQIEMLRPALQIPYYHHEKWDGTGYPQGLAREDIPLVARMFSVVDVWDVLISDRPYRNAMTKEEALDLILSESGSQFDPEVVSHFVKVLKRDNRINTSHELKINAFGHARVWLHNRPVTIKDWEIYAARDLFFLFLSFPKGLTKEQVGLHMWPDLSPDELDVRFKNTLYRLRRGLGKQTILFSGNGYHFNRLMDYQYDVEFFNSRIQKAKEEKDPAAKLNHLIKAVEQYHGEYLQEIEEMWAINDRERYRMMFLTALVEIGTLFLEQKELESALSYVNRALEEDPLFESAHRLAMRIYAKMGDRAGVVRQYEACRSILLEKFDTSPSIQTHELYNLLTQS